MSDVIDLEITDAPLFSSHERQAIDLLGSGIMQAQVAYALGMTESAVSQMYAREEFKEAVAAARYKSLQAHNLRDKSLDTLEDKIIDRITRTLDLVFKPLELTAMLKVVNGARRRGLSAPEQLPQQQKIVTLTIPAAIQQQFITDASNQVIKSGEQSLVTLQSMNMDKLAGVKIGTSNGQQQISPRESKTSIRVGSTNSSGTARTTSSAGQDASESLITPGITDIESK